MNNVLQGFVKEAIGKSLLQPKNLMRALGVGMVAVPTALAARAGYKSGRAGDEKPRYLAASFDPISGHAMPSRAGVTNYNVLTKKPTAKEIKRVTKNYKEKAFK